VNTLLGLAKGPTEILRNLEDLNARRRKNRQITIASVSHHRDNHFNIQEPAKAALRRTLEERAREEDMDLMAEGVRNILTARGYLEIIANKGLEHLLKDSTEVPYDVGVQAQLKLEQIVKSDEDMAERAAMRRDVALIQQAITEEFSEEEMRRLSHRINVLRGVAAEEDNVIEGGVIDDADYDDEDEADFTAEIDDDDELE
jgi:hypothetical protein